MPANTTKPTASKIKSFLLAVGNICEIMAIIVLFAMMFLTGCDVVARYFFNSPINGAFELTEIFLGMLVFLSLPVAALTGSHIKVEIIESFGSKFANRFIGVITSLIGITVFAVLTVQLFKHALKLQRYEQVTNSLELPLYLIGMLASFCCLLSLIMMVIKSPSDIKGSDV